MKKINRSIRYRAIEILTSQAKEGLPIDQIMESHLVDLATADPRDRQLLTALVYGALRWRGYLDWVVEKVSTHPLAKMKNRTLQALRVGLLQLLFLDRIPVSAAINETVQALKDMRQPQWLTGYLNGVLRSVARQRGDFPIPPNAKDIDSLPAMARLSHPAWLLKRWEKRYGPENVITICEFNNKIAPVCLRVNTTLTTPAALLHDLCSAGIDAVPGQYSPLAIHLNDYRGAITALPGFADGLFQVQDEAAQLVSLLLGPLRQGKIYLDGCSGRGGKTSHLAQMLPADSQLIAIEPNVSRSRQLQENLARLRLAKRVTIVEGILDSLLSAHKNEFSGILIDAPCSGLGVIRRQPDIRWNRGPDDLARYHEQQLRLLTDAAALVATQGILVYATCSTEPEENDAVVNKFLATQTQFILSPCQDVLPAGASSLADSQGFFRTLPGRDDLDGFFGARLLKK